MPMAINVGDILTLKKPHPCGDKRWMVLRVGMDFRLRCMGCGREILRPRADVESKVVKIETSFSFAEKRKKQRENDTTN